MQKITAILFTVALFAGQAAKGQHIAKFQSQTEAWLNAYNSGNAENLKTLYTDDAKYMSAHVPGLEAFGIDKVIAYFQAGISGGGHIDSISIISIEHSGKLAYLITRYYATNSGQQVSGRNLLVMRKVRKKWLIAVHMTVV